jgi:DNA repair exonuclease SbcCD nuclease subunit
MKLQLLSDLHLESEPFVPEPAPGAELLVLAGDIDSTWAGFDRFAGWPVPVLFVAGNHEFDGRDLASAWGELRRRTDALGWTLLERERVVRTDHTGRRVRFVGTVRWSDFDLFGPGRRDAAMRGGEYFMRVMGATEAGNAFGTADVRKHALTCKAWLEAELSELAAGRWDKTVAITHFAPSLRSVDPRYGTSNGTGSFCNADDHLLPAVDLWLHGHLHCRHDYLVERPGAPATRVVCQARGLARKGEDAGFEPARLFEV